MRLVTRGDLDGLCCAVFITSCETIDEIALVHPQDITDEKFAVKAEDILANVPYHSGCAKWFDHHLLTESNAPPPDVFEGRYGLAPSAARMVYEYYMPAQPDLKKYERLLAEVDRLDSAQLNIDDVLDPKEYILLGYTLDPRTGLGTFHDYFLELVSSLKSQPIAEIMKLPEVKERVKRIQEQDVRFREITLRKSKVDGNVVFSDFRDVNPPPVGNRFLVYTLYPLANISLRVHRAPSPENVAVVAGHSIFNRTSRTNVGALMSRYGGGGHRGAGTCLLSVGEADKKIAEMLAAMKKDG